MQYIMLDKVYTIYDFDKIFTISNVWQDLYNIMFDKIYTISNAQRHANFFYVYGAWATCYINLQKSFMESFFTQKLLFD